MFHSLSQRKNLYWQQNHAHAIVRSCFWYFKKSENFFNISRLISTYFWHSRYWWNNKPSSLDICKCFRRSKQATWYIFSFHYVLEKRGVAYSVVLRIMLRYNVVLRIKCKTSICKACTPKLWTIALGTHHGCGFPDDPLTVNVGFMTWIWCWTLRMLRRPWTTTAGSAQKTQGSWHIAKSSAYAKCSLLCCRLLLQTQMTTLRHINTHYEKRLDFQC